MSSSLGMLGKQYTERRLTERAPDSYDHRASGIRYGRLR